MGRLSFLSVRPLSNFSLDSANTGDRYEYDFGPCRGGHPLHPAGSQPRILLDRCAPVLHEGISILPLLNITSDRQPSPNDIPETDTPETEPRPRIRKRDQLRDLSANVKKDVKKHVNRRELIP